MKLKNKYHCLFTGNEAILIQVYLDCCLPCISNDWFFVLKRCAFLQQNNRNITFVDATTLLVTRRVSSTIIPIISFLSGSLTSKSWVCFKLDLNMPRTCITQLSLYTRIARPFCERSVSINEPEVRKGNRKGM